MTKTSILFTTAAHATNVFASFYAAHFHQLASSHFAGGQPRRPTSAADASVIEVIDELDPHHRFLVHPVAGSSDHGLLGGECWLTTELQLESVRSVEYAVLPHDWRNGTPMAVSNCDPANFSTLFLLGPYLIFIWRQRDTAELYMTGTILASDEAPQQNFMLALTHDDHPIHWIEDDNMYKVLRRASSRSSLQFVAPQWLLLSQVQVGMGARQNIVYDIRTIGNGWICGTSVDSAADLAALKPHVPRYPSVGYWPGHCMRCDRPTAASVTFTGGSRGLAVCRFCWIRYSATAAKWLCIRDDCGRPVDAEGRCEDHPESGAPIPVCPKLEWRAAHMQRKVCVKI